MFHKVDFVISPTTGEPIEGVSVRVRVAGAGSNATIYSDDIGTTTANPVTTDEEGRFEFYVPDNRYDLHFTGAAITTYDIDDIELTSSLSASTADEPWVVDDLTVDTVLIVPVAAPTIPAAGHVWALSDLLKHGANSMIVADISREQAFTKSQTVTATATAGKVGLTIKGNATAAANVVEVHNSAGSPVLKSWFDSAGLLGTSLNLTFKSGTSFTGTLDHAATADRTWAFPDAAGTVALTTAPGTSGTDVAWSAAGQLLIPDASGTNRGVITTGTQTIAGAKSFTGNMALGTSNTLTIGDTVLSRSAADTLQLATGDIFVPQTDGGDLGTTAKQWSLFTDLITVGTDVVLARSAADTLRLATGDSFIPQSTGQDLGGSSNRWDVFGQAGDFSTTLAVTGAATLSSFLTHRKMSEVVTLANTIAASESGTTFYLDSATEFDSVLPAPALGLHFTFIIKTAPSGGTYTISTNASANVIKGQVYTTDVNSATDPDFETAGCDTINFVDSKAVAGDTVEVQSDGTSWFARGFCSVFDAITFTTAS